MTEAMHGSLNRWWSGCDCDQCTATALVNAHRSATYYLASGCKCNGCRMAYAKWLERRVGRRGTHPRQVWRAERDKADNDLGQT